MQVQRINNQNNKQSFGIRDVRLFVDIPSSIGKRIEALVIPLEPQIKAIGGKEERLVIMPEVDLMDGTTPTGRFLAKVFEVFGLDKKTSVTGVATFDEGALTGDRFLATIKAAARRKQEDSAPILRRLQAQQRQTALEEVTQGLNKRSTRKG